MMAELSEVVIAVCALIGLPSAALEYWRARKQVKLELAQRLMAKFDSDDMVRFATTSLDWAWGLIPVPLAWREIVKSAAIAPNAQKVLMAVQPQLTAAVAADPETLLYRHAFVYLFNQIESMADLTGAKAINPSDLVPIVWTLRQLRDWRYGSPTPKDQQFLPTMNSWYEKGKLVRFIDSVIVLADRKLPNQHKGSP